MMRTLGILLLYVRYPHVASENYAMGGDEPILWRKDGKKTPEMQGGWPAGLKVGYVNEPPEDMIGQVAYNVSWYAALDTSIWPITKVTHKSGDDFYIPHANVHSCLSHIGFCTPLVANTPELSTHTKEQTGDIVDDVDRGPTWVNITFQTELTLNPAIYVMISHVRFFIPEPDDKGGLKNIRYDMAAAIRRTVKNCPPPGLIINGKCINCGDKVRVLQPDGDVTCENCPAGSGPKSDGSACELCDKGHFSSAEVGQCFPCPEGSFTNETGMDRCLFCETGTFSNETAMTGCYNCSVGKFQVQTRQTACQDCLKGFAGPGEGLEMCERCPRGRYMDFMGSTSCNSCQSVLDGATTTSEGATNVAECVCPQGFYAELSGGNTTTCIPCPKGMVCPVGSSMANYAFRDASKPYPKLLPMYWSDPHDPLSVYECSNERTCPGGDPGNCPGDLSGRMCSGCKTGFRRSGESCLECSDLEKTQLLFPILPLILGPIIAAAMYSRMRDGVEMWGSWRNGIASMMLLLLNHYQMIALIRETNLNLSKAVKEWWSVWSYLNNILDLLSPDCAGFQNYEVSYIAHALGPAWILLILVECFVISRIVGKFKPEVQMDFNRSVNVYFSFLYTFYVAVVRASIDVFLCVDHPNETQTVASDPSVFCDSEKWNTLAVIGGIALALCVLTGAVFAYILYVFPSNFSDESFRRRWKFLVMKFRADVWWWGVMWLLKGLLMNIVLLSSTSFAQIFGLFLVMCAYMIATVSFYPWRHYSSKMVEREICVSILVVTFLSLCNTNPTSQAEAETWCIVVSLSPFPLCLFIAFGLFLKSRSSMQEVTHIRLQLQATHLKIQFGSFSTLTTSTIIQLLKNIGSADRRQLVKAADIVIAEMYCEQPRERRLGQRLMFNPNTPYSRSGSSLTRDQASLDKAKARISASSRLSGGGKSSLDDTEARAESLARCFQLDAAMPISPALLQLKTELRCGKEAVLETPMLPDDMSRGSIVSVASEGVSASPSTGRISRLSYHEAFEEQGLNQKNGSRRDSTESANPGIGFLSDEESRKLQAILDEKQEELNEQEACLTAREAKLDEKQATFEQQEASLYQKNAEVGNLLSKVDSYKRALQRMDTDIQEALGMQKRAALKIMEQSTENVVFRLHEASARMADGEPTPRNHGEPTPRNFLSATPRGGSVPLTTPRNLQLTSNSGLHLASTSTARL